MTHTTYLINQERDKYVHLLLIQDYFEDNGGSETNLEYHIECRYVWIKDPLRLLSWQLRKNTLKKIFHGCLR